MSRTLIAVQGTLKPGGNLQLDEEPPVAVGRMTVFLDPEVQEPPRPRESTWVVLERIWAQNKAEGRVPPTAEQIDAEINAMRDEWEERMEEIEALQADCERARRAPQC
jgi:hypothetical protein